ncbi:RdgB/HAM1 family non-canonical purine NTP pyrophosphatase [Luteolibacter sp. GHJ8]|uniref:dITP/XTP pyrophosphatase n=1 Tax=Luteolibacter rhizosphaerae TaxID=2989719 RepID=A0ABT3FY69_9BACT|nr:RdgB/HAM1 family non-canonical purine NTP pyrophosphatase [Luteolibacter rhizosphaerae]MCW1912538.1 RdgB/HAM1 family non-canonical purine NTP pyrophosphatase [Luteolibacter rhizosphaerae]
MSADLPVLVIATRNAHKTQEIREMIGTRYMVLDANDFPNLPSVEETGTTFLENATLKAQAISREVTGLVLSDDSGLEVDALRGAPGVWSSSFGGEDGNHAKNNARLMRELEGQTERSARFRCTMVLAENGQVLADFSGTVEGRILDAPFGAGGFGYDPLFAPEGHDRSFAELGPEVKNALSHRGRTLAQVVAWLESEE